MVFPDLSLRLQSERHVLMMPRARLLIARRRGNVAGATMGMTMMGEREAVVPLA